MAATMAATIMSATVVEVTAMEVATVAMLLITAVGDVAEGGDRSLDGRDG